MTPEPKQSADITKLAQKEARKAKLIPEKKSKESRKERVAVFVRDDGDLNHLSLFCAIDGTDLAGELARLCHAMVGIFTHDMAYRMIPSRLNALYSLARKGEGDEDDTYALVIRPQIHGTDRITGIPQKNLNSQLKYNKDECRRALQAYKLQFQGSIDGCRQDTDKDGTG